MGRCCHPIKLLKYSILTQQRTVEIKSCSTLSEKKYVRCQQRSTYSMPIKRKSLIVVLCGVVILLKSLAVALFHPILLCQTFKFHSVSKT